MDKNTDRKIETINRITGHVRTKNITREFDRILCEFLKLENAGDLYTGYDGRIIRIREAALSEVRAMVESDYLYHVAEGEEFISVDSNGLYADDSGQLYHLTCMRPYSDDEYWRTAMNIRKTVYRIDLRKVSDSFTGFYIGSHREDRHIFAKEMSRDAIEKIGSIVTRADEELRDLRLFVYGVYRNRLEIRYRDSFEEIVLYRRKEYRYREEYDPETNEALKKVHDLFWGHREEAGSE